MGEVLIVFRDQHPHGARLYSLNRIPRASVTNSPRDQGPIDRLRHGEVTSVARVEEAPIVALTHLLRLSAEF